MATEALTAGMRYFRRDVGDVKKLVAALHALERAMTVEKELKRVSPDQIERTMDQVASDTKKGTVIALRRA